MVWTFTQVAIIGVGGLFICIFAGLFIFVLWRLGKTIGLFKLIKNILLATQKKKLLKDDKLLKYCVEKINEDKTEQDVRTELLIANKYKKGRIDQIVYVFNIVKKELEGGVKDGKGQRRIESKISKNLPD